MDVTTASAARFALDEEKARAWLTADIAKFDRWEADDASEPAEAEIGSGYAPAEQCDGHDTQSILYYARANGFLTGPGTIEFDFCDDGDHGYVWLVYLDGPGALKLSTYYSKIKSLGRCVCDVARGAGAALCVLQDAVISANGLLDDLDGYMRAALELRPDLVADYLRQHGEPTRILEP